MIQPKRPQLAKKNQFDRQELHSGDRGSGFLEGLWFSSEHYGGVGELVNCSSRC
jgi:hypothetical protein